MAISGIYVWYKLHDEKINFKNIKIYISVILITIICVLNYYFINSYIKIFLLIFLFISLNYYLFPKDKHLNIIIPIINEFIVIFSEFMIGIIAFGVLKMDLNVVSSEYFGTLFINILISSISILLINFPVFKKITNFMLKITNNLSIRVLFVSLGLIMIIINFFAAVPYYKIKTEYILIFNVITIAIYSFIVINMLEQKNKYIKMHNKYNMTNTTLKELEQNVTRLKIANHENKNQLLTIRNMIKKGEDNKKLIKHIEKIVDTKIKDDEQLMFQTSIITNSMISSIIYSKMLTMKENKIDTNLSVDRDIKDLHLSDMDEDLSVEVCKIIGVYLDNAIEEVTDLEQKLINIEVYAENKMFCISIANNYEGEIKFDQLNIPGYTTKENGHGYGLPLVTEIVNGNDKLSINTEIQDNIFKQILKIKM